MVDFDHRGYLVRFTGEERFKVYAIPGTVDAHSWRFKNGAAAVHRSLTDAIQNAKNLFNSNR